MVNSDETLKKSFTGNPYMAFTQSKTGTTLRHWYRAQGIAEKAEQQRILMNIPWLLSSRNRKKKKEKKSHLN